MKRAGAYTLATVVVAACTGLDWVLRDAVAESDLIMVFLVGVLVVARLLELGPALWAATLSVAAFDVLFVPPRFTFAVAETRYLISFLVMGATGFVLASTTARLRTEAERARQRAQRLEVLYELSRDLVAADPTTDLASLARNRLRDSLGVDAEVLAPDAPASIEPQSLDIPLDGASGRLGILRVASGSGVPSVATRETLAAFAHQLTLATERARLSAARHRTEIEIEQERLRSSLLSSVSHDLRTPLGSIMGAASTLLGSDGVPADDRQALLGAIHEEASRLSRLLDNLLQMTRIEGGAMTVRKRLEVPEEVVGAVLARFADRSREHRVIVDLDEGPALVPFDPLLIELVLANLVDNSITYSPPGARIWIRGHASADRYRFMVEDEGPGVARSELARIFEKFHRGDASTQGGAGLGLAICRAIVRAHGGEIFAEGRSHAPGLRIVVELPLEANSADEEEAS